MVNEHRCLQRGNGGLTPLGHSNGRNVAEQTHIRNIQRVDHTRGFRWEDQGILWRSRRY